MDITVRQLIKELETLNMPDALITIYTEGYPFPIDNIILDEQSGIVLNQIPNGFVGLVSDFLNKKEIY